MMPTFPPPPLKFRTVGFPQYGFKASLSARACPAGPEVKRPPRIPSDRDEFTPGLRLPDRSLPTALRSGPDSGQSGWGLPARRAADPRGPQLRPGYAVPALLAYTPPCASLGSTRGLRGFTAYTPGLRWAGAPEATPETFPTFAAGLSARATDSTPVGPLPPPVVVSGRGTRLPRVRRGSPPTTLASASNARRGFVSTRHPSRDAAARAFAQPSGLASEVPCPSRFGRRPSPVDAGRQARWANGKSPIVGTSTRLVPAASTAALELSNVRTPFGNRV